MSYYGHSENVLYRLGRHFNDLQAGRHDNSELQTHWLQYGRDAFEFRTLELGTAWKSKHARVAREKEYFQATAEMRLYNKFPVQTGNIRIEVILEGQSYRSAAEAARALGVSETTLSRLIRTIDKKKRLSQSKPLSVGSEHFESIAQASKVLNLARSTIVRRLNNPAYTDWVWGPEEKTRSNDYPVGE